MYKHYQYLYLGVGDIKHPSSVVDIRLFLFNVCHLQTNVRKLQLIFSFVLTAGRVVRMTLQLTTSTSGNINKLERNSFRTISARQTFGSDCIST